MSVVTVDQLIGNPNVAIFAANSNVQQQLQDNYAQEHLSFRLTGNLTLAGYTAAPAKLVESLENLISSLQITATGKGAGATTDQVCSVDAAFLAFKTRIMEGTAPTRTDVGTANGTYAFESNFKKYFVDPRSNRGGLTVLYTALLSTLTASYQFRDSTALVTGGTGGTATLSGVQITVQSREYLGLPLQTPSPYVKETQRLFNITQSQNLYRAQNVPVGNILRRQTIKGMLGANNYSDPSDSLFGATGKLEGPHVQLVINNQTKLLDMVYQQMRADDKTLFSLESIPAGYVQYEPARNARLNQSIPLGNVAVADNYLDLNYTAGSTNSIQITDEQIVGMSSAQYNS
jgi:hypothetical protein